MKSYERETNIVLNKKVPVIGRVDGKCFSKFTKSLKKSADSPWSSEFIYAMTTAATAACKEIQGCKMAYVQSDEISFLITDTSSVNSEAYHGYKMRKMDSIVASTVTVEFFGALVSKIPGMIEARPKFDARFWNLSTDEIVNYFIYRQQDAVRNSVQMLARHHFSHKDCCNKSVIQLKDMLQNKGIVWKDIDIYCQRGAAIVNKTFEETLTYSRNGVEQQAIVNRKKWVIDWSTPIFTEDRNYIENLLAY